ncbi:MAG: phosphodiesterase [Thermosipho sp. (in: Bacteria)]|nr:phosphodiesterase [Thermosipho sp. (in: thermotogales)]
MKILVVSDTHGSLFYWKKINHLLNQVNEIFHLGDVLYHGPRNPLPEGYNPKELAEELKKYKINYVRGNCDADVDLKVLGIQEMPKQIFEFFGDYSIFMLHGEIVEEDNVDLYKLAKNHEAKILLHGHTHIPKIEEKNGIIIANPGSLALPKENNQPTYMIIEFSKKLKITIYTIDGTEVISKEI